MLKPRATTLLPSSKKSTVLSPRKNLANAHFTVTGSVLLLSQGVAQNFELFQAPGDTGATYPQTPQTGER